MAFQMSFQDLFKLSMKRELPELYLPYKIGGGLPTVVNVGSGREGIPGAVNLNEPDWRWPRDCLPALTNTIDFIHCYHFLEHLPGQEVSRFLLEAQRALRPGGILQFCVPYYSSALAHQDLDHKTFWTEETFKTLFKNQYYDVGGEKIDWKLEVHFQVIAGIVERNLALMGQLIKVS